MEHFKENLLKLYPDYDVVYGPYKGKDERERVVLCNSKKTKYEKGKIKTISYPKAVVETVRNERLQDTDTVDHIDRDKTNQDYSNFAVRSRSEHASIDALRVKVHPSICPGCGDEFIASSWQRNSHTCKNSASVAGPFCSKSCAGRYGASVQNGGQRFSSNEVTKTYYRVDKT